MYLAHCVVVFLFIIFIIKQLSETVEKEMNYVFYNHKEIVDF